MATIFDKDFFQKLGKINLAMNMRLDQGQCGQRKSTAKGSSVEFSDFREYILGDDIRRIDWNAYGRLNKLFIKQFMEEKEAFYHIFLDSSASMDYGAKKKSHMALQLAAVFVYLVQKQLDRVELFSFSDGNLMKSAPVTSRNSFGLFLNRLEELEFKGDTGINKSIRSYNIHGKGVSIIISDFLEPEGVADAIKYLTYKKQQIFLVQVLAREEVEFDEEGALSLQDMENGNRIRITVNRQVISEYKKNLDRHTKELNRLANKYNCAFIQVISDENLENCIFKTMRQKGIFG